MPGALPIEGPPPTRKSEHCGTADYRMDTGNGSMVGLPHRDQHTAGICGAEVVADLVDAWGLTHDAPDGFTDKNQRTSPIIAAIGSSSASGRDHVGGGKVDDIFAWIAKTGSCNQAALAPPAVKGDANQRYDAFNDQFHGIYDEVYEHWDLFKNKGAAKSDVALSLACDISSFKREFGISYKKIFSAFDRKIIPELFVDLFLKACDGNIERPSLPDLRKFNANPRAGKSIARELNSIFNAGGRLQPISVNICKEAYYQGADFKGSPDDDSTCTPHISAIIGRRWNAKKFRCEFLIRNSWAVDCGPFKHVACEKKTGNLWVSAGLLDSSAWELRHLNY
jgi:hypothetical protein